MEGVGALVANGNSPSWLCQARGAVLTWSLICGEAAAAWRLGATLRRWQMPALDIGGSFPK